MAFECQNCGQEIPDEVAMEDIVPEGMGVFMHKYSPVDELGTITDYYCNAQCLAEAKEVTA